MRILCYDDDHAEIVCSATAQDVLYVLDDEKPHHRSRVQ